MGCAISRVVFQRTVRTAYFQWRFFSSTVSMAVLAVALGDARALLVSSLWVTQMLVPLSDAFVGSMQGARLALCVVCLLMEVQIVVIIALGLVPSANPTVAISAVFDYSSIQLVRDMLVAQVIILGFEMLSLLRSAHNRRFLHLTQSVAFSVRPITFDSLNRTDATSKARRVFDGGKFHGDVSQLVRPQRTAQARCVTCCRPS